MDCYLKFSLLISIYGKENPAYLEVALNSIIEQLLLPNEIVIVEDGPLSGPLISILDKFENSINIEVKRIKLELNRGLGYALNIGILHCENEYIARADTDDILHKERFKKQLSYLFANPIVDILGSNMAEFEKSISDSILIKCVPEFHNEILKYSKFRNPMNHPTVVFKKHKILAAGNYQTCLFFEDYLLWVKLLLNGCVFHNLQESLVYFRKDGDMLSRRHGFKYFQNELKFLIKVKELKFLNFSQFIINVVIRALSRLLPKKLISFLYNGPLRKVKTI